MLHNKSRVRWHKDVTPYFAKMTRKMWVFQETQRLNSTQRQWLVKHRLNSLGPKCSVKKNGQNRVTSLCHWPFEVHGCKLITNKHYVMWVFFFRLCWMMQSLVGIRWRQHQRSSTVLEERRLDGLSRARSLNPKSTGQRGKVSEHGCQ